MTSSQQTTQSRIVAYIDLLPPERITVDATCGIADALGVPVERFLIGENA